MRITHGVVAVTESQEILHFVGYEQQPTVADYDGLLRELGSDPELGLAERVDWTLRRAYPWELRKYQELTRRLSWDGR